MISPKPLASPPDSDLHHSGKRQLRRLISGPAFPLTAGARPVKGSAAFGGRRGSITPLIRWKFDDVDRSAKSPPEYSGKPHWRAGTTAEAAAQPVSARKLATGIWFLWPCQASGASDGGGGGDRRRAPVSLEPVPGHLQLTSLCKPDSINLHATAKNELMSPISVLDLKNGNLNNKLKPSAAAVLLPIFAMEGATKWDPGSSGASVDLCRFFGRLNLLEDNQVTPVSVVSDLQAELKQAHACITSLETERRSAMEKLDQFLRELAEENALWRRREHKKVRAVIDGMKDDLNRERRSRQRMEILNSKLADEFAEAKLSVKRLLQEHEMARKAREIAEELCNELARGTAEDKAMVGALKREAMEIQEEVEEERETLHMAEIWREERVRMKLMDAKLTLEDKHSQLSKLQEDIETFLKAQSFVHTDAAVIQEAVVLLQERANSVVVPQEIKEYTYQSPPVQRTPIQPLKSSTQEEEKPMKRRLNHAPDTGAAFTKTGFARAMYFCFFFLLFF